MFELIGATMIPIILYVASRQFEKRVFKEIFIFLAFAFLILGTTSVYFPQLPEWFPLIEFAFVIIIYPIARVIYLKNHLSK